MKIIKKRKSFFFVLPTFGCEKRLSLEIKRKIYAETQYFIYIIIIQSRGKDSWLYLFYLDFPNSGGTFKKRWSQGECVYKLLN